MAKGTEFGQGQAEFSATRPDRSRVASASSRSPVHSRPIARLLVVITRWCRVVGNCGPGLREQVEEFGGGGCGPGRVPGTGMDDPHHPDQRGGRLGDRRQGQWSAVRRRRRRPASSTRSRAGESGTRPRRAGCSGWDRPGRRPLRVRARTPGPGAGGEHQGPGDFGEQPTEVRPNPEPRRRAGSLGSVHPGRRTTATPAGAGRARHRVVPGSAGATSRSRSMGWNRNHSLRPARPTSSAFWATSRSRTTWPSAAAGQLVGQCGADPVGHAGGEQELPIRRRQPVQHFLDQVFGDQSVAGR